MKLLIAATALLVTAAPPPAAAPAPAIQELPAAPRTPFKPHPTPIINPSPAHCTSILRQVQEANKSPEVRRNEARTLNQEPSAHLLLAVDRQVDGCREVTFLRRDVAPGGTMPRLGPVRD